MKRDCACPQVTHRHGTIGAYRSDRCRCFECRLAKSIARLEGRQGDNVLVSSIGVQRRLQALATLGWGSYRLADLLGVSNTAIDFWRGGTYPTVRPETVAKVAALYDALWDRPAPRIGSPAAKASARRHGWLPPLAWDDDNIDIDKNQDFIYSNANIEHADINPPQDGNNAEDIDEIAVAEAVAGRPVALTKAEVSEAVATMRGMGYSARETAERLRTTERTVTRRRTQNRKDAA